MTIPAILREPINSYADAKKWVDALVDANLDFHFDDGPEDQVHIATGIPLFTAEEASVVRDQCARLYDFDWNDCGGDPMGYMMDRIDDRDARIP